MSTVAIICEYNPFHSGHEHQINAIRDEFGNDTCIIAIMSGNFTQRGELAIADKAVRSKCAIEAGVNLCLELPFPYSMSSAEFFAKSAVHIANSIGTVDYLSFGSESGDIDAITTVARCMLSDEYKDTLNSLVRESGAEIGYPRLCELALQRVMRGAATYDFTPNNILAIEYVKALINTKSSIKPHTIKREGAAYHEPLLTPNAHPSASAVRAVMRHNDVSAFEYIPNSTKDIVLSAIKNGELPSDEDRLSAAVISHLRLTHHHGEMSIHDAKGGLYNRLLAKSFEANNIATLVRLTETKKYTTARIRRVIWYSLLGVTSSEISKMPMYTQLLAMDSKGQAELKKIKGATDFPIITKPSRVDGLSHDATLQKALSDRADSIFQLALPKPKHGNSAITFTPYVKYDE